MATQLVWWWVVPAAQANASARPASAQLISTPNSGAEYQAFSTGGTYNGLARFQGPFTSATAAKQANPAGGSTAQVIAAGAGGAAGSGFIPGVGNILAGGNPLSGAGNIYDAVTKFLGFLGDRSSWIRIAEVIIGVGLVIVAADELAKGTPAANAAHTVAKAAMLK